MFVDNVKIHVKAGNGGSGAVTFRREKYIDSGGPDGGDGGRGGSIVFKVDTSINTLLNFRYQKKIEAHNGENGAKRNCTGKSADDVVINVPQGTIIKLSNGKILADLSNIEDEYVVASGGRGGKGNAHFATSARQAPRFAMQGEEGEEKDLDLELKLIADVGLIGFPNVGKSSIISKVSEAKVKIANYPFTTLEPNLGVVKSKDGSTFVMADIPGIVEGASDGVGLGLQFLKHVERTRLLLHVIDVSGFSNRDVIDDYNCIRNEIKKYSTKLAGLPEVVVANKADVIDGAENIEKLKKFCKKNKIEFYEISAVTGKGVDNLIDDIAKKIKIMPKNIDEKLEEVRYEQITLDEEKQENNIVIEIVNGEFKVSGRAIVNLMRKVNVEDIESRQYMMRCLSKLGLNEKLRKHGIKEGDTVDILDYKFIFQE